MNTSLPRHTRKGPDDLAVDEIEVILVRQEQLRAGAATRSSKSRKKSPESYICRVLSSREQVNTADGEERLVTHRRPRRRLVMSKADACKSERAVKFCLSNCSRQRPDTT